MKECICLFSFCLVFSLRAQTSYTSYFTGDTTDFVSTTVSSGIVLAGGGSDNDQAMQWMLQRAGGGDVLVLRASGSDGYNNYFFSELGVSVNSVETIKFNNGTAANAPYVLRRIEEAELIFFAGGDQGVYAEYWRDTPVDEAINTAIIDKGITVGGTSAGMAILGGTYYAPINQGVISQEALSNPFHANIQGISNQPFINLQLLSNTVTDTHFENRDRQGRLMVFMGRGNLLTGQRPYGIAANNATAITIDETGTARVFGEHPAFDDYAFFLQPGCSDANDFEPETILPNQSFTWNRDGKGVSVYRVPGTVNGTNTFDLTTWAGGEGGEWQNWTVVDGVLNIDSAGEEPVECAPSSLNELSLAKISLAPLPTFDRVELIGVDVPLRSIELFDREGRSLQTFSPTLRQFSLGDRPTGLYWLRLSAEDQHVRVLKVIVR